jgi:hypothetical protein
MERVEYALGLVAGDLGAQVVDAELLQTGDAAEFSQQLVGRTVAHAGDLGERGADAAARPPLAVKADGETVRFVADLLDQVEYR